MTSDPSVEVRLASGSLLLTEGEQGVVAIEVTGPDVDRFHIEQRGSSIRAEPERAGVGARWRSYDLVLRVPAGTSVTARLASADLDAEAALGMLEADLASGRLRAGDVAGDAKVKTASGDIRMRRVGGSLRLSTASGDVELARLEGDARVNTASGDVRVGIAAGDLVVKTASGDVRVGEYRGADVACTSMSGDVRVGVPPGRSLDVDLETLSGSIRNDFEVGGAGGGAGDAHATLRARTLSGDVELTRVAGQPA